MVSELLALLSLSVKIKPSPGAVLFNVMTAALAMRSGALLLLWLICSWLPGLLTEIAVDPIRPVLLPFSNQVPPLICKEPVQADESTEWVTCAEPFLVMSSLAAPPFAMVALTVVLTVLLMTKFATAVAC